jgi:prevent-host-death family protein
MGKAYNINNMIGAFEAKTHLSQLLEKVQKGNEIIITKRGKPVARLIPFHKGEKKDSIKDILKDFDVIRESIKGHVNIKSYINEGRKY